MLDQLSEWEGTAAALVWLRNYCPNEERSWFHCQEKAFGDVGVLWGGGGRVDSFQEPGRRDQKWVDFLGFSNTCLPIYTSHVHK